MFEGNIIRKNFISALMSSIIPVITIYSYCVFVGLYCIDDHKLEHVFDIILFLIFHFILLYTMIFYMRILSTEDESTINKFPHIQSDKIEVSLEDVNPFVEQEIMKKKIKSIQICNVCNTYKPPRSHHCSFCRKCYLKMDHHCFPLGTCIAFHNYKFFYNFLVLNSIFTLFNVVVLMFGIFKSNSRGRYKTNYIISIVFNFIDFCVSTYFISFHTKLISMNETTVENLALDEILNGDTHAINIFQEGPLLSYTESKDRYVLNPYNLGKRENWIQVFGHTKKDWVLPSFTSVGDGIAFPKNYKEEDSFDV
ncbi:DHHC zinc finger protein [Spraguea lophii 42_110]|uniref:Palmitoyltransferase n=1 Tax=Spraguea lophii (strain 42_110) TaxID=1358809 RepID=S7W6S5_SPRLO|nr:DHHC zinc finger protein [Spraguea lophii 42_110]